MYKRQLRQLFQNALDLADAGQKQQHRSLFMPQELRRRYRHRLIKTLVRGERAEATLHRISAVSYTHLLLALLGEPPLRASQIAAALGDWTDSDGQPRLNGAEDEVYKMCIRDRRSSAGTV